MSSLLSLCVFFLLGVVLRAAGIVTLQAAGVLSALLLHAVIPLVVVGTFSRVPFDAELAMLPLAALLVLTGLTAAGVLAARLSGLPRPAALSRWILFPTLEGGSIGYPLALMLLGERGLALLVLFDFANALWIFTVVQAIAASGREFSPSRIAGTLVRNPILWALAAGIGLNLAGLGLGPFRAATDAAGASLGQLILLMLGISFSPAVLKSFGPTIFATVKMATGGLLGAGAALLLGLSRDQTVVVVFGAMLPPSIMTAIYAREHQLDATFVDEVLAVGIPLGVLAGAAFLMLAR